MSTSEPKPERSHLRWLGPVLGIAGFVGIFLLKFYGGSPGEMHHWFSAPLTGELTPADVDTMANGFVTNLESQVISPDGTRRFAPDEGQQLRAEVHRVLDPLIGRDTRGPRIYVDDDRATASADFGDTRIHLTLLPTDIGHAITRLEVGPRR